MKKRGMSNFTMAMTGLIVMIVCSVALIASSEPLYKRIAGRNRPVSETAIYNPGSYEGEARGYGGTVTVKIEVTEYEIEDVKITAPDETPEIGKSVAVKMEKEIWKNQSQNPDSVSGATMTSNAVKKAFSMCLRQAAKEGTELSKTIEAEFAEENRKKQLPEIEKLLKVVPDGTYSYIGEAADDKGFKDQIQISVKNHEITALIWDCVNETGIGKRILSEEGQYDMTENGPKWFSQADALAAYLIKNQTDQGLMDESGYVSGSAVEQGVDAVASVSIYIGGFVDSVKKCLIQSAN